MSHPVKPWGIIKGEVQQGIYTTMATIKRSVYLVSEQQRNALLNYLQDRPYREVAAGIEFLLNAPTANLNVDVPEEELAQMAAESEAPEVAIPEMAIA
jgi:hypothetical protein